MEGGAHCPDRAGVPGLREASTIRLCCWHGPACRVYHHRTRAGSGRTRETGLRCWRGGLYAFRCKADYKLSAPPSLKGGPMDIGIDSCGAGKFATSDGLTGRTIYQILDSLPPGSRGFIEGNVMTAATSYDPLAENKTV